MKLTPKTVQKATKGFARIKINYDFQIPIEDFEEMYQASDKDIFKGETDASLVDFLLKTASGYGGSEIQCIMSLLSEMDYPYSEEPELDITLEKVK
jgi:hypothetical protein